MRVDNSKTPDSYHSISCIATFEDGESGDKYKVNRCVIKGYKPFYHLVKEPPAHELESYHDLEVIQSFIVGENETEDVVEIEANNMAQSLVEG